jgi:hypothetical protein
MYIYIFVAIHKMEMSCTNEANKERGMTMGNKIPPNNNSTPDKSEHEKEEAIEVFRYFENANIRNREAFAELLEYTMENRRNPRR